MLRRIARTLLWGVGLFLFLLPIGMYQTSLWADEAARAQKGQLFVSLLPIAIPLWLLAAVCLVWPVTSFITERRRRGRGFEVETKATGDSAADPPDAAGRARVDWPALEDVPLARRPPLCASQERGTSQRQLPPLRATG
jgi:hypothetical protein